jgi:uncharacterized protein
MTTDEGRGASADDNGGPSADGDDTSDDTSDRGGWRPLHPRVRLVWWLGGLLGDLVLITMLAAVVAVLDANTSAPLPGLWYGVPIALALAAVPLRGWYAAAAYRAWRYRFGADHLELRHGVFWRRTSSMPYHRVQQVDEGRGPLERWLGMATLQLRSAAATTDASIPGLDAAEVESLRELLMQRAGRDDGA